jgi:uncharacterized protein (DUF1778 family)
MRRPGQRPAKINLRLDRDTRRKLEHAAAYEQKTLTNFVIDAALQKAEAIDRENMAVTLTPDEWGRLQGMILDPPQPNRRLRDAFAEHARIVRR